MLRDESLQLAVVGVSFAHYLCVVRRCVRSVRCHKKLGIPEMPLAYVWFLRSIYIIMCIAQYQLLCVGKNASPTLHTFNGSLYVAQGAISNMPIKVAAVHLRVTVRIPPS